MRHTATKSIRAAVSSTSDGVDLGAGGNVLVGALAQHAADPAGHAVDFRLQRIGDVGADRGQLPAPSGIVAQVEFGPQAAHAVMKGLELLGDIVELAAPDIGAQAGREEGQIVQRDGDGNAVGRRGDANFIVGGRHLDGEADDLPWRGQPLHHQRQRERQQLRRLQRGNVERRASPRRSGNRETPAWLGQPAAEGFQRLAGLQHRADRQQILDDIGRADTGQRTLLVVAGHRRGDLDDRIRRGELELADRGFEAGGRCRSA